VAGEGFDPARGAGNALRDHPCVAGSLRHGVCSQGHSVEQVVFRQAAALRNGGLKSRGSAGQSDHDAAQGNNSRIVIVG
jgi:hypothetical protein